MKKSLLFLLATFFVSEIYAATFTVTSTTDVVDAVPGNGACATAGGACTLRAAIQEANALAGADSIVVPSGIFSMTIAGVGEELAATGDYDISDELTITGAGAGLSIVNCGAIDRAFDVRTNVKTTFSKIWIKNCSVIGDGGAIRSVSTANLSLTEAKLSNNRATNAGALVHAGELTVTDSIIDRNYASNAIGGIYKHGNGNATISASDITSNTAVVLYGGLLLLSANGSVNLSSSDIFDNNAGSYGAGVVIALGASGVSFTSVNIQRNIAEAIGGILVQSTAGPVNFTSTDVSDNVASSTAGSGIGGLYVVSQGDLTANVLTVLSNVSAATTGGALLSSAAGAVNITNSKFSSNSARKDFGGINVSGATGVSLTDTIISDNISNNTASVDPSAGGMYVTIPATAVLNLTRVTCNNNISLNSSGGCLRMASGVGALNITSSTFDGNYADTGGGAVVASLTSATATSSITGSTFSNNSVSGSSVGGGLFLVSVHRVDVLNSTFSSNVAVSAAGIFFAGNPGMFVKNSTFFENKASATGSSIGLLAGTANLENNILYDGNTDIANCGGAAVTSAGNNISDDATCGLSLATDRANTNPLLSALADNGGGTLTHAISTGSPALDGVSGGTCPATDQRGVARPFDGNQDGNALCDIGSFEANDACPSDPDKTVPGVCGCGMPDVDSNGNGILDCLANADADSQAKAIRTIVNRLKKPTNAAELATQKARVNNIKTKLTAFVAFITANASKITVTGTVPLATLVSNTNKRVRKALKFNDPNFGKVNKPKAKQALNKLIAAI